MWEDRKKQELKEAAMHHAKTPSKDCDRGLFSNSRHPMLSSWIQSRKLTITIKSILLFQPIKKVLPSSLRGSCNIVVPTVDSLRGTGNSDRRFLQLLFFPVFPHTFHPEKTYNLEPPISMAANIRTSQKYYLDTTDTY